MTRPRHRHLGRGLAAVLSMLLVNGVASACSFSFSVYDLPLPGGTATGDDPYRVTVEFDDALDLVPRSTVKVDDVDVGEVERIRLDGYTALADLRLDGSVRLPANARARIRQTSLLGEKFVTLEPPGPQRSQGRLSDGDVITLEQSSRAIEVEEVLSSLSLLLHGGGLGQLRTINTELTAAMEGREESIREVLRQLEAFVAELDDHKADITRAIDELDRMTERLANQRDTIGRTLDDLPDALSVLADQREDLTTLLTEMSELGAVGSRVIEGSSEDLLANLRALDPVLTELAKAGDDLPNSLQLLVTYPFADSAVNAVHGDYTNLQLTLDLDLRQPTGDGGPELPELPVPDPSEPGPGPDEQDPAPDDGSPDDGPPDDEAPDEPAPDEGDSGGPDLPDLPLPDLPGGQGAEPDGAAHQQPPPGYDEDLAALMAGVVR